jgi:hypothetical protein
MAKVINMKTRSKKPTKSAPANPLPYDSAVLLGKAIVAEMLEAATEDHQRRLGELADRIEPKYGKRTLEVYAKTIGINKDTLERYRSVYRAWKKNPAPGPVSYAVQRALQNHPDRADIVARYPKLTQAQARAMMREYTNAQKNTTNTTQTNTGNGLGDDQPIIDAELLDDDDEGDEPAATGGTEPGGTEPVVRIAQSRLIRTLGQFLCEGTIKDEEWHIHARRWFKFIYELALQAKGMGVVATHKLTPAQRKTLLKEVDFKLLPEIREGGMSLVNDVDWIERQRKEADEEAAEQKASKPKDKPRSNGSQ